MTSFWGDVTACSLCGRIAEAEESSGQLPLDWSLDFNERGALPVCPTCTRARLREIEGKLSLGDPWEG